MSFVYQYPDFGPWKDGEENYLWIELIALKIQNQKTGARQQGAVNASPIGKVFRFLAPRTCQIASNHTWEQYENITSRLAGVMSNWLTTGQDISSISRQFSQWFGGGASAAGGGVTETGFKGQINTVQNALMQVAGSDVINYRVDFPLVYKASEPLQYVFEFDFAAGKGSTFSHPSTLYLMLRELLELASPKKQGNNALTLDPPNIFTVKSTQGSLFHIQYAAIRSIQNEYNEPFHDGYPAVSKSTITFEDITPLFDQTFRYGGSTVISSSIIPG